MYEVSNLGRIKSLEREKKQGYLGFGVQKERIMNPAKRKDGYLHINLINNKNKWGLSVHQLIAIVFLGHVLCGSKLVIDHINGIKTDNRVSNLRIVTQRYNLTVGVSKRIGNSQYTGVCWHKRDRKWIANITISGKLKHLGSFENELDAANAYKNALASLSTDA